MNFMKQNPNSVASKSLILCLLCLMWAAQALSQTTIFSENFDGAWPNTWYVGNDGGVTTQMWGDNSYRYYAGGYSGFCADNGNNSANGYTNNLHTYMEKRGVSLVGYSAATLTFKYYINSEATYDNLTVNVRNQAGSWSALWTMSGSSGGWVTQTISLSSFVGQSGLYVQFRFDSDASVNVTGGGAWVDDVLLTATPAGAPEMDVRGNGVSIVDGDTTPSTGDGTDFGSTPVGTTVTRTLWVYNTGTAALTPGTVTVPSGYTLDVGLIPSIAAGSSDYFTLHLNATAAGTYAGDISIGPNNDANENPYNFRITGTVNVVTAPEMDVRGNLVSIADGDTTPSTADYTDFGSTPVGTPVSRTFWVHNTGSAALTPGTVTVPSGFTLDVALISSIAAGASDYFTLHLNATASGTYAGDISIGPNNDANENPYNFRITGTVNVVTAPEMDVRGNGVSIVDGDTTPSTTDFTDVGSTSVGTTVTRTFWVFNTGTAALTPGTVTVPSGFTLDAGLISSIAAGASDYFTVHLNATAFGTYAGDISIGPNNDANENPYNFRVTGSVIAVSVPEMDVRGNGVSIVDGDTTPSTTDLSDFGSTTVGTTVTRTFWVYNTGTAALTPGTITVPSGFTLTVGLISSIAAGGSDYFTVRFNASSATTYAGDISIPNNDANENPYNFRITGTATPAGIAQDAYEADDTAGTAKSISNGSTQNRNIHTAGNVDWVKFTIGQGGAQNVRLETDGPSGDSQMWLYGPNSSTTQMTGGYSDDEGNGAFSLLVSGVNGLPATLSPGTYYIKITEYLNDGTILAYTLAASWTEIPAGIPADAYEADDSAGAAKTIANGATQNRNIHAVGNVDWVKFTVGQAGAQNVRLETDGASGDSQMWLYGPNNSTTQVAYDDDDGNGLFSLITTAADLPATLPPGTYYIKITEFNNDGTIPAYTLRASWTEVPAGITADAYEADDNAGVAKTISNGQTQSRNIHAVGNADWVKFTVGQGGAQNVRLETDGPSGDSQMWLYGPNSSTTQAAYDDDDGNGAFSLITTAADLPATLPPGIYYIKITEYNNDGTIPAYTLSASWTEVPVGITPDAYEADDSAGMAKTISNGQTQNRNIHTAGNVDWATFTIAQGGAQNVRVETDGASGDSQTWLYGPNSSTIQVPGGFDDDDGNGAFSLLVSGQQGMPATLSPGTYYIKVQEFNNDGTIPAYTLRASWDAATVTPVTVDGQTPLSVTMSSGQVKWYQFTLNSRRAVYLETSTLELDTVMYLYSDAQGQTLITSDDDSGVGYAAKISGRVLSAGTYYVKIVLGTQARTTSGTFDLRIHTGLPEALNVIDWGGLQNVSRELYGFFQTAGAGMTKLAMAKMTANQTLFDQATAELQTARREVGVLLKDPSFDLTVSGSVAVGVEDAAGVGGVSVGCGGSVNFIPGVITGPNKELSIYIVFSADAAFGGVFNSHEAKLGLIFEDEGIQKLHDWYTPDTPPGFWGSVLRGAVSAVPAGQSIILIKNADAARIEGSATVGFDAGGELPYGTGLECRLGAGVAGDMEINIQQIWGGVQDIAQALANSILNNGDSMEAAMNDLLSSQLYAIYGTAYVQGEVAASAGLPIPVCPVLGAGISVSAGVELGFSTKSGDRQGPLMSSLNAALLGWFDQ